MGGRDEFGWVGSIIDGKYRIDAVIGEGGFGIVYGAYHLGFGTRVAVKCLKVPGRLDAEARQRFLEGFLSEGKLLHQLSRANAGIVQALDIGATESPSGTWCPYLVLEWMDGRTLEEDLASRTVPRSVDEAVQLLEAAAGALATAHAQAVAHRDVKPANIFLALVGGQLRTKILDFGIAKVLMETTSLTRALASTGQSIRAFTPQYGAPEQFDPRFGATGPWTDVYAFALLFVEVVSGRVAMAGSDTTQLYILATDRRERPTPRTCGVVVSDAVEATLLRALQVEPRDRYHSLGEMWSALVAAVGACSTVQAPSPAADTDLAVPPLGEPAGRATGKELPQQQGAGTTRAPVALIPAAPTRIATSRRGVGAWVAAGGVAVAAISGAFLFISRDEKPAMPPSDSPVAARESRSTGVEFGAASFPPELPPPPGMIRVAAERFSMGKAPGTVVTISRPFFLDATEVTAGEYVRCLKAGKCTGNSVHSPTPVEPDAIEKYAKWCINVADASKRNYPINCIDRDQAEAYCRWSGKRLPAEAEWELAARGPGGRRYAWGSEPPTCDRAVFSGLPGACGRRSGPFPVMSAPEGATPEGAQDMSGNVWEWVQDGWSKLDHIEPVDPVVPSTGGRGVLRGGSWDFAPAEVTTRIPFGKGDGQVSTGVRCAKNVSDSAAGVP